MAFSREKFYKTANTPGLERMIYDLGQSTGLGQNFHERHMWKESSGRTGVAGDDGASIGLGQIYDPTWEMLQGIDPTLKDRTDPAQNIRAQKILWARNLKAAGGNQRTALRMYNGSGPMAEAYANSLSPYLPNGSQYSKSVAPVESVAMGNKPAPTMSRNGIEIQPNPMQQQELQQQELQLAYNQGIRKQQPQQNPMVAFSNSGMNPYFSGIFNQYVTGNFRG